MMQNTAIVINAGIGALSLGLKMAGVEVVAAYEEDRRAAEIHRRNLDVPVFEESLEAVDPQQLPEIELLAAQINLPGFQLSDNLVASEEANQIKGILHSKRPRAFFLLVNAALARSRQFPKLLSAICQEEYSSTYEMVDVGRATGLPVNERMACVVGLRRDIVEPFYFPNFDCSHFSAPQEWIWGDDSALDEWFYDVREDRIDMEPQRKCVLCWKDNAYREAERVQWNFLKMPLVYNGTCLRRISFREIAALKGFPEDYWLNEANKQWLYKCLTYTGNVSVLRQISEQILRALQGEPQWKRTFDRAILFEEFVGRYLQALCEDGYLEPYIPNDQEEAYVPGADFIYQDRNGKQVLIEVKWYSGHTVSPAQTDQICHRLSGYREYGMPILVVANEVASSLKNSCFEHYGVTIWDIKNILWLLKDHPNLRNDFIAFLDRTVEHILPEPPILALPEPQVPASPETEAAKAAPEPTWKERLAQVEPGKAQSEKYEATCTELLKYIFGDYLTLWKIQEKSNDGLYRFDLCCKIKGGIKHDFFDTIQHYFNTKYIVFEFKNYAEKIGQKEIYTTEKYLYEKALRKVAIIISRMGADEHAEWAAKGALRENGKLILCLNDQDVLDMVQIKDKGEQEPADFLGNLLDDLLVHLEK